MKSYFKLIIIAAAFSFALIGCEEVEKGPVYSGEGKPASIITPASGGSIVLNADNSGDSIDAITWTEADYGVALSRINTLQLGITGTNFLAPVNMISTPDLSYQLTVGEFNLLLVDLGLTPGAASSIDLRVRTTVANQSVDTLYSDPISVTVTSYAYSKPNIITPAVGDYELAIDSMDVIPFEEFSWAAVNYGEGFNATYILEFDLAGNSFANAVELYEGINTFYTPTNFEINNAMLGLGVEAGTAADVEFRVRANTGGRGNVISDIREYNIKTYTAELQIPPLYLVGNATLAGWDNAAGIELEFISEGVYSTVTTFAAGGMKVLAVSGQWAPQWGDDGTASGILSYRPDEATPDPAQIPSPGVGDYRITVDIINLTYTFEAQ